MSASVGHESFKTGDPLKHRFTIWNFDSICYTASATTTSGLPAAILRFRCRTMSESVGNESIEIDDPDNMGTAFGITTLSFLERESHVLPVWRPPYCVSGVR